MCELGGDMYNTLSNRGSYLFYDFSFLFFFSLKHLSRLSICPFFLPRTESARHTFGILSTPQSPVQHPTL